MLLGVCSRFSQEPPAGSREGGLWDDSKLEFCQEGGVAKSGTVQSRSGHRPGAQGHSKGHKGPDIRDLTDALTGEPEDHGRVQVYQERPWGQAADRQWARFPLAANPWEPS